MTDDLLYEERISSNRTEVLFLALMVIFLLFLVWRVSIGSLDLLVLLFFCLFCLFLFYSINYRTLIIRITQTSLKLTFGIFTWGRTIG